MTKIRTEDVGEFYLHYPFIATIVTCQAGGKENAMAVAWHCAVSRNPPLYAVSISPRRYTHELILQSKEFGVNFLPYDKAQIVAAVGGATGREVDKLAKLGLAKEVALKTKVPILRDAYLTYECTLQDYKAEGDHTLMVGRIVAVQYQEGLLTDKNIMDLDKVRPTLYMGADTYAALDKRSGQFVDRKSLYR
ncbi:MAG: flavin reductase family protein [Chloroflexota bacterium]|nr:flavin reductase family protein [Chloroflexota bacterium]